MNQKIILTILAVLFVYFIGSLFYIGILKDQANGVKFNLTKLDKEKLSLKQQYEELSSCLQVKQTNQGKWILIGMGGCTNGTR